MTQKSNQPGKPGKEKESKDSTALKKIEPTFSERFSNMVIQEFTGNVGSVALTAFQKRLIQNYFISTDMALKTAEERRLKKSEQYRDLVPITWANVNMESLALNVVACAKIGFDPALPNHINMVPYKNNNTNKYDVDFIEGYRGIELKAKKYGYDMPDYVIVKLVYKNEKFTPVYKDKDNSVESYLHKPADDPFNPGDIVGGYYYHAFKELPEKNKLMFYNLHEIEKRKPQYASVEFWGGEKTIYKDGKKNGTEKVEGWFAEMCWKTLYRLAHNAITIDSEKIDENLMRIIENEALLESNRDPNHLENVRGNAIAEKGNVQNLSIQDTNFEEVNNGKNNEGEPAASSESEGDLATLGAEKEKEKVAEPY